jgi:hypothetical protein
LLVLYTIFVFLYDILSANYPSMFISDKVYSPLYEIRG